MNVNQMKAFRELMLTGSVSEAARNLNRTQPSISHLIQTLERDLDIRLFERRGGRLHPVQEAHYLFEECKELLHRLEAVSRNMKRIKAIETGELRIASMPGPAVTLLPEMVCRFIGDDSEVKATVLSRSSDAVLQLVASQQFDLGIADYSPSAAPETSLVTSETYGFQCFCAMPSDDPLAECDLVTPQDLAGKPMAVLIPEHQSHIQIKRAFEVENCPFNVRFVHQFFLPHLAYVEKGLAYAVVDPLTIESWRLRARDAAALTFIPFRPVIYFGVVLLAPAYRPESLVTKGFRALLREELGRLGGVARDLGDAEPIKTPGAGRQPLP